MEAHVLDPNGPIVDIPGQGKIQGEVWQTFSDKKFHGFRAVPFAKPPIGELRFQIPEDPEPWQGIRRSSNFTQITCAQMNFHEVRIHS